MTRKHFGTDGVRGRANDRLTPDLAMRLGQAAGAFFRTHAVNRRVVIGKDTRISGYMIETALVAGFTSIGMHVLHRGPMPSPAVAMLTRAMRADLGVMISASHNPFADNGIKLFGPDGFKLTDAMESRIEAQMETFTPSDLAASDAIGRAKRIDSVRARYVEFVKRTLPRDLSLEGLRIVIDCASGAAYKVAPEALWELGAEVIAIGVEPDGFNINRDVGSTSPEALRRKVPELRADIGVALDGDADRVLVVDQKGRVIDGDQILALIADQLHEEGRLSQPGIVATVMSNGGLESHLAKRDLALIRTAVGDRYVIERMREWLQYRRRGVRPHHPVRLRDDGRRPCRGAPGSGGDPSGGPARQRVCRRFEPLPQIVESVPTRPNAAALNALMETHERRLEARGRLLVRASGTENLVRIMAEGEDPGLVRSIVGEVCGVLRNDLSQQARAA